MSVTSSSSFQNYPHPRENDGTEREAQGVGRDMSCPRKLFTQRKSRFSGVSLFSETSACSLASLSGSSWHFVRHRPLSHGSHFESQENKKLCFCPSSLALDERWGGQNLLFQHCVIKFYYMTFLLFFQTSDRGLPACGRLERQTSAKTKTSVRLKITFVDMHIPRAGPGPSLSVPHFLLPHHILLTYRRKEDNTKPLAQQDSAWQSRQFVLQGNDMVTQW